MQSQRKQPICHSGRVRSPISTEDDEESQDGVEKAITQVYLEFRRDWH